MLRRALRAYTLQPRTLALAVVVQFLARLSTARVSETRVHVRRRRAGDGVCGRRGCAGATFTRVVVSRLTGDFGGIGGLEGGCGGSGAGGKNLGVELRRGVLVTDNLADLVL